MAFDIFPAWLNFWREKERSYEIEQQNMLLAPASQTANWCELAIPSARMRGLGLRAEDVAAAAANLAASMAKDGKTLGEVLDAMKAHIEKEAEAVDS